MLGISDNGTIVSPNWFDTDMFINANMTIIGSSGSGKTFTEELIGRRMYLNGCRSYFIIPKKGLLDYYDGCANIGGTFISLAPGARDRINVMDIRPEGKAVDAKDRNYDSSERGDNGTAKKASKEECRDMFNYGDYKDLDDIILGCDPENVHEMYTLNTGKEKIIEGLNKNVFVVGAPGCGKTFSYIIPAIMQKIKAGESMVVTDLKKDIYGVTAEMARASFFMCFRLYIHIDRMIICIF